MPPRGTRDVLPPEARVREHIASTARRIFESYGYGRIQTPTFEETDVFAVSYTHLTLPTNREV